MKYDLHTHTYYSDGTASPRELIFAACEAGLGLVALTDHDTTMGIPEARTAAQGAGLPFLCGVEVEAEYNSKLHILGLGVDPDAEKLSRMLINQEELRCERNERMLDGLTRAGYNVRRYYKPGIGCTTRTHIAKALVRGGYADSIPDAFTRFIGRESPFFIATRHPCMRDTVEAITSAGGRAVLAHPHKMRCDHAKLVRSLADCGLWGVEAYYPGTTAENIAYFKALAEQYGLAVTCGSDFHGENRKGVTVGCAWRDLPELNESFEIIKALAV